MKRCLGLAVIVCITGLQGVNAGDTVEIAYTESMALKVEGAPKQ